MKYLKYKYSVNASFHVFQPIHFRKMFYIDVPIYKIFGRYSDSRTIYIQLIAVINLNIPLSSFFCYLLYHAIKEKFTFISDIKYRAEKLVVRIHQNISTLWYILKSYYFFPSLENLGLPRWLSWERICLQCRRPRFDSWVGKIPWRRDRVPTPVFLCFPCGLVGKEFACNMEDLGLIPWLGRSPGEGKGYPLQYSGLENSMNCIAYGVAESDTTEQLSLSLFWKIWKRS